MGTVDLDQKILRLKDWFTEHHKTLSFAESCTGGLLSASVTSHAGVSAFFLGAVVSYHGSVKESLLDVPAPTLKVLGEVSTTTARYMARGVKKRLKSDWAVAVTGVAGPSGGTPDKPVGFVCFAVAGPGFEEARSVQFNANERRKIQLESVHFALDFLWDSINGYKEA